MGESQFSGWFVMVVILSVGVIGMAIWMAKAAWDDRKTYGPDRAKHRQ